MLILLVSNLYVLVESKLRNLDSSGESGMFLNTPVPRLFANTQPVNNIVNDRSNN